MEGVRWSDVDQTTPLPSYVLTLNVIGPLTGVGREAVVQRVTEGAHWIHSRFAGEAGRRRLVSFAAVLPVRLGVGEAVASAAT